MMLINGATRLTSGFARHPTVLLPSALRDTRSEAVHALILHVTSSFSVDAQYNDLCFFVLCCSEELGIYALDASCTLFEFISARQFVLPSTLKDWPCDDIDNIQGILMKFGKTYTEYIERETHSQLLGCSYVEFKRLKKVLKSCPLHHAQCRQAHLPISSSRSSSTSLGDHHLPSHGPHDEEPQADGVPPPTTQEVSLSCPGCDAKFFGELMEELAEVVGCFNTRAQELLQQHLASGVRKFLRHLKFSKLDRAAMIQQGRYLVSYAFLNATAVRKILKKYDKVHQSNINGGAFRRRLLAMRGELLQSPWFVELSALHLNLADSRAIPSPVNYGLGEFSCDFESDTPTLSCTVLDSARLEFGLNCSICLDTVFDPVALGCGHVFCNSCVCAAASVLAYEGPRSADFNAKCPLCRKAGVYLNAVRLKELATLVHNRCNTYWTERLHKERKEQLREAKMASDKILQAVLRV